MPHKLVQNSFFLYQMLKPKVSKKISSSYFK